MKHKKLLTIFSSLMLFILMAGLSNALSSSTLGNLFVRGNSTFNGTWVNITQDLYVGGATTFGGVSLNGNLNMTNYNITNLYYINPEGTLLDVGGNIDMNGKNVTKVDAIIGDSDNVRIGNAGTDSHSLTSDDDLFVSGKLEVDGISYFDGGVLFASYTRFNDNIEEYFGSGGDSRLDWSTAQAIENTLVWGLGATSRNLIFADYAYRNSDYDHPAQSNPTLFMQSNEDPGTSNIQWGSTGHDGMSFVVDSGTDNITLDDSTNVAGDLTIGDNLVGNVAFELYADENNMIINTSSGRNISIYIGGTKAGMISGNATCLLLYSPSGTGKTTICD